LIAPATVQVAGPQNDLRGEMVVTAPPELALNDKLEPGDRIRGQDNMLAISATLVGQRLVV
jgi:hypothetical protein